jgi:predicted DNA-binding transcriptional regulator
MVSKDQSIGGLIFLVCVIVAIFYVVTLFYPQWLVNLGWATDTGAIQFWLVAVPVFIAFVAVMAIGAWIGWTMATTPPPKPIEELTSEVEEKKEEEKPEEKMEAQEETATEEEKKSKKKGEK